jgi:hypothetical protein
MVLLFALAPYSCRSDGSASARRRSRTDPDGQRRCGPSPEAQGMSSIALVTELSIVDYARRMPGVNR